MDLELDQGHELPEKRPGLDGSAAMPDKGPRFFSRQASVKDETILARFGKRQQLRVKSPIFGMAPGLSSLTESYRDGSGSARPLP